jgi:two-component system cell cycle sensor histidine kinase/response regulator CckA
VAELDELRLRVTQLEAQLLQSQKLQTIGALAGGVAHDFNNLLTAILGHASVLATEFPKDSDGASSVETILSAADRASQLTRQLLNFARPGEPRREIVDLHKTLAEVVGLLRHTIDKRILVEVVPGAADGHVEADPGQMFQVLLNLTLNAKDAMPEGGLLSLRTASQEDWFCVSVEDTGHGIPVELRSRIFEPFFTTKGPARGAGMGLPVALGIVQAHGGRLEVESIEGKGTKFHVWLPLLRPRQGCDPQPEVEAHRGKGTVLVVDDEDVVRLVAVRMLRGLGYETLCAGGGREAVDLFRANCHEIDIVLLDLILPDLNGLACLAELRVIEPNVRVILSSGYGLEGNIDASTVFLQKPYRLAQLSEALAAAAAPGDMFVPGQPVRRS